MQALKTVTTAQGQSASIGSGVAFWRRATGLRTTCGFIAVAALTLVGPAHVVAAPVVENGPANVVEALGGLANQVAAANSELAALNAQLAGQREAVNKTLVDLQRARAAAKSAASAVQAAQKAITWANDKISAAQKAFDSQAALAYTRGSAGGGVASYLSSSNPEEFLQRGQALALVSEAQNMSVESLIRARNEQADRLAAAKEKQAEADAAQSAAQQRKAEALNAIAAVRQAAAQQAAKAKAIEVRRHAAQATLEAAEATQPASAVQAASTEPAVTTTAAEAAPATEQTVEPLVEAAAEVTPAPAATTVTPAATTGASDWVQLLLEIVNTIDTGSAGSGSADSGSAGTGSAGSESEPPAPIGDSTDEVPATGTPAPPTEDAAAEVPGTETPTTETPSTETPTTETPATEDPVTEEPAAEVPTEDTTDDSEYYEDDVVTTDPGTGGGEAPNVTGSEGVEIVVSRAMSQLGVMYAWGGGDEDGPTLGIRDGGVADSYGDYKTVGFDCSGLMVYAFAGVGISLPHYSGYQYTSGRQVPIANVQRGDMIFWGGGGSQHVALYLGDGMMIEAMQSGTAIHVTEVRYSGIQPYAVRLIE